jgi:hypothetical protein
LLSSVIVENIENTVSLNGLKLIGSEYHLIFIGFFSYILLETGYPFAFYDFDKISSKLG